MAVIVLGLGAAVAVRVHDRRADERARERALAHRHELQRKLETAVTAYARGQVAAHKLKGPILRTHCELYDGTNVRDPSLERARYSCTAIRIEDEVSYLGHLFVGVVDFDTGRIRFHRKGIPIGLGV